MPDDVAVAQKAAADIKEKIQKLDDLSLDLLLREARTHNGWIDRDVTDDQLRQLFDLLKSGPTSANCSPARIIFVRSKAEKQRLIPALSPSNVDKTRAAPITAIIGYDTRFYDHLLRLFPQKDMTGPFKKNAAFAETTAFRNGTLQGAYFIIAARAIGLDTGAMSGFDNAKVDEAFFKGTSVKSNFLCNLGYGDPKAILARSPRFDFDEVCKIV